MQEGNPETKESVADTPYPVENARHDDTMVNGGLRTAAAMADKSVQRASLKEKLAAYRAQVPGKEKPNAEKLKGKEETL